MRYEPHSALLKEGGKVYYLQVLEITWPKWAHSKVTGERERTRPGVLLLLGQAWDVGY